MGDQFMSPKTLRLCGDCHEYAKFVSKVAGREIVLRNSNIFHKFEEGREILV
jgi:DYW family of nucleic acid deaminases